MDARDLASDESQKSGKGRDRDLKLQKSTSTSHEKKWAHGLRPHEEDDYSADGKTKKAQKPADHAKSKKGKSKAVKQENEGDDTTKKPKFKETTSKYPRKTRKQSDPEHLDVDASEEADSDGSPVSYFNYIGSEDVDEEMDDEEDVGHVALDDDGTGEQYDEDEEGDWDGEHGHFEEDEDVQEDTDAEEEFVRVRRNLGLHMESLFGGMASDLSGRLRSILESLKNHDDPTMQLIALQELAEILSVSSEDNLAGYFASDSFVKELVRIMKGHDDIVTGVDVDDDMMIALAMSEGLSGGNPEIMLLACRCISNLLDAMPSAVTSVVYHGAIRVLCQKLKSIEYIDLAEQALCALEKIASHLPRAVVQEGGLGAALLYFDFFSIHSQRTALRTASNCMRGMDTEAFSQVTEVIPTLMNTLSYSDRTIIELTCLCWVRLAESYRSSREHLEKVLSVDLLKTMMNLVPISGNSNAVRPATFMDLLRVFRAIAKGSPKLGYELLKLNIVGILYQVLTGTPALLAEEPDQNIANINLDSKWHDSVPTIMKIVVDLLPSLPKDSIFSTKRFKEEPIASRTRSSKPIVDEVVQQKESDPRIQLFKENPELLHRTDRILVPLLLEIYTSTVNIRVRHLVTSTLVKIVHFSEVETLRSVLKNQPLSSFLAGILAQQEYPALIIDALYQAELLHTKLPDVYHVLFEREGVLHEAETIAKAPMIDPESQSGNPSVEDNQDCSSNTKEKPVESSERQEVSEENSQETSKEDNDSDGEEDSGKTKAAVSSSESSDATRSKSSSRTRFVASEDKERAALLATRRRLFDREDLHALLRSRFGQMRQATSNNEVEKGLGRGSTRRFVIQLAQNFVRKYHDEKLAAISQVGGSLGEVQKFAEDLRGTAQDPAAKNTVMSLLHHLQGSNMGISSFELVNSGLMDALLAYLTEDDSTFASPLNTRWETFRLAVIQSTDTEGGGEPAKGLRVLVTRLQELLNRVEHFEVVTPLESTSSDSFRNPTNMLAKQLRLRLTGEGPDIPREYQHLMVSTHTVATFKVLEEYLLARIGSKTASSSDGDRRKKQGDHLEDEEDDSSESSSEKGEDEEASVIEKMDLDEEDHANEIEQMDMSEHVNEAKELQGHNEPASSYSKSSPLKSHTKKTSSEDIGRASSSSSNKSVSKPTSGKWQIKFSLKGTPVSNDTTVYGAVHQYEMRANKSASSTRNIWGTSYPVTYERVWVPQSTDEDTVKVASSVPVRQLDNVTRPENLEEDGVCTKVLRLLKSLSVLQCESDSIPGIEDAIHTEDFINRKLTAKMNRQLEEPLIVASSCLPSWTYWLMAKAPFLFPFETRHLFIQSTSFGYSRLIARWQSLQMRGNGQNSQRDDGQQQQQQLMLGRMERQKVRIMRSQMLESAIKILDLFGSSQSVLEVEYMGEEGTGLGPTLEFYASTSKEFCKKSVNLWRDDGEDSESEYISTREGLFPGPLTTRMSSKSTKKVINLFKTLGQFVAKAMLDFRIIDIPFSTAFFKVALDDATPTPALINEIDPVLGKSISDLQAFVEQKRAIYANKSLSTAQKLKAVEDIRVDDTRMDDMCLDFTLPGNPETELKSGGADIPVTIQNVEEYIGLLVDMIAGSGVRQQITAFRQGFDGLFAIDDLKILTHRELVSLFGTATEDWSYSTLADAIKADHGFTMESLAIKNLLQILSELNDHERREFLQFTTGSPRLPIGGWKAMRPVFTVVRKVPETPLTADDYLPSVMTCANYLKMPEYSNKEVMHQRLIKSMQEGKNSFLLS
ncbi:Ubiquitin fusion degradation protein 4 [Apophysomyces sp. BC1034]|nr:Ubiquitin fusion degradation protein 4 [Apophysomyces sp. BC1021]KAG0186078.1 Ubiquitin fusion degradation protein 4 [Apophysomyces sp. BC1034]